MNEQSFNLMFVREVEKRPVLYDYKLSGYSFKDVTENAWKEVAEAVQLSVSECRSKWKNLRAVFVRHVRPSQSGGSKTKKPYYLADAMQFALPFIKVVQNNPDQETPEELQITPDLLDFEEGGTASEVSSIHASSPIELPGNSQTDFEFDSHSRPKTYPDNKLKRARIESSDAWNEVGLQNVKKDDYSESGRSQTNRMFLLSLLPELEEMTDSQMKLFRRRVLQLIDNIMNGSVS